MRTVPSPLHRYYRSYRVLQGKLGKLAGDAWNSRQRTITVSLTRILDITCFKMLRKILIPRAVVGSPHGWQRESERRFTISIGRNGNVVGQAFASAIDQETTCLHPILGT